MDNPTYFTDLFKIVDCTLVNKIGSDWLLTVAGLGRTTS